MKGVPITFISDTITAATIDSVSTDPITVVTTATVSGHNPGAAHIHASATDGTTTVNSAQSALTVVGPSLSINDVSLNEGNAGTTIFTFIVGLNQPAPKGGVSFSLATQDSTATVADNDYQARILTGQTIPTGQQSYTFDVAVNGDLKIESNETFFVNVTNVNGASLNRGQGVGTTVNDDIPMLSVNDVSGQEGDSGSTLFTFTVSSTLPAPAGGIIFDVATHDNTATAASGDYVARSLTSQSIPAGQQSYTLSVIVNGDTLVESDESFFVNISNVSGGSVSRGQGVGTILNDDAANLVISQLYGGGGNSGAAYKNDFVEIFNRDNTTIDFAVTNYSLQNASSNSNFGSTGSANKFDLTSGRIGPHQYFLVQLAGGTSGADLPTADATGSISMAATTGKIALVRGTTALAAVTCPIDSNIADLVGYGSPNCFEGSGPTAGPGNTTADFRKAGGCTDADNNAADFFVSTPNPRNLSSPGNNCSGGAPPNLSINDVTVTEGNSGTTTAVFTVSLSAPAQGTDVTFDIATQDNAATVANNDYVAKSLTNQIIPAGQTTYTFAVIINGDTAVEPNETFFVNVANVSGANVTDGQGVGTIQNDDFPSLSINDVSANEGNAGTSTFSFVVNLSAPAPVPVTFDIATQDSTATAADSDYVARSLTAQTIATGQQTYHFDVTVNGDTKIEPNETFFVNVTNVSGASVTDGQAAGTILNDDTPVLTINDVSANEGNSGTTNLRFTVTSTLAAPTGGITFDIVTQDGTATVAGNDYAARNLKSQTIPAGQQAYLFDVNVNGDTLVEPNETFFVNLTNASSATIGDGQGQGTILNDDTANLVISQVFGGGGNSGATLKNDFVEIFNRGTTMVDFSITPYLVQYASANASGNFGSDKTNLTSGTIAPGKYFLLQEAAGSGGTTNLPAPDATGSIALTTASGKVALVAGTTALSATTCPGDDGASPFNPNNSNIADFVGYGATAVTTGHCYEGAAPTNTPSNTTAAFRKAGGCTDTNNNAADSLVSAPFPRNSASPANNCTGSSPPNLTINDVTATEGDSGTTTATFTVALSTPAQGTDVTFDIATQDNTATTANNDYVAKGLMNQFIPAGQTTYTFAVTINGDTAIEPNETFFVNVTNVSGATVTDGQGVGTIHNDDLPTLSVDDVSADD